MTDTVLPIIFAPDWVWLLVGGERPSDRAFLQSEVGRFHGMTFLRSRRERLRGVVIRPLHIAASWLLPDGRAVLDPRPLPFLKRTFLYLMLLRVHGYDLRRWT